MSKHHLQQGQNNHPEQHYLQLNCFLWRVFKNARGGYEGEESVRSERGMRELNSTRFPGRNGEAQKKRRGL